MKFFILQNANEDDRMLKINELLKMIEAQEKAGGESCTPGTELELGENIVDSYGKVCSIIENNVYRTIMKLIREPWLIN